MNYRSELQIRIIDQYYKSRIVRGVIRLLDLGCMTSSVLKSEGGKELEMKE